MQDDLDFPATLPSSDVSDPQASVTSDCSVSRCLVYTVTLIVVFPQRGYRIKPTNNQKIRSLSLVVRGEEEEEEFIARDPTSAYPHYLPPKPGPYRRARPAHSHINPLHHRLSGRAQPHMAPPPAPASTASTLASAPNSATRPATACRHSGHSVTRADAHAARLQ